MHRARSVKAINHKAAAAAAAAAEPRVAIGRCVREHGMKLEHVRRLNGNVAVLAELSLKIT